MTLKAASYADNTKLPIDLQTVEKLHLLISAHQDADKGRLGHFGQLAAILNNDNGFVKMVSSEAICFRN